MVAFPQPTISNQSDKCSCFPLRAAAVHETALDELEQASTQQTSRALVAKLAAHIDLGPTVCKRHHWFGGVVVGECGFGTRRCFRHYVKDLLQMVSKLKFVQKGCTEKSAIDEQILSILRQQLPTSRAFIDLFFVHDEHLLQALCDLCRIDKLAPTFLPPHLHPLRLWLLVLNECNYSVDVIIDWLLSESEACAAILELLKLIQATELQGFLENQAGLESRSEYGSVQQQHQEQEQPLPCADQRRNDGLKLKIFENVAGAERELKFSFCSNLENKKEQLNLESSTSEIAFCDYREMLNVQLLDLFVELNSQLKRYSEAKLFPYKVDPLLKHLSNVIQILQSFTGR